MKILSEISLECAGSSLPKEQPFGKLNMRVTLKQNCQIVKQKEIRLPSPLSATVQQSILWLITCLLPFRLLDTHLGMWGNSEQNHTLLDVLDRETPARIRKTHSPG